MYPIECKHTPYIVLIETLWNVKHCLIMYGRVSLTVLIETLWNVKSDYNSCITLLYLRINRNIVECKAG